jgi:NitT/TauT family transport system substrate-binding protein
MVSAPGASPRSRLPRSLLVTLLAIAFGSVSIAAGAEQHELRIGVQFGLGYLPLYVARDAGLLEKHMAAQGLAPLPVRIINFTGGPQIQDGLLSQSLDIGAGGITVLLITHDKTRAAGDNEMRGLTALSSVPYELWTVDPRLKSLRDLDPQRNRIGLPAVKVSVPAIFLQMAAEQIYGVGKHAMLDALTVSLAQPDGVVSLAAGGGTVDSYLFAPPFSEQMRDKPGVHRAWSSEELFGSPITALATWTTARFRRENPKLVLAFIAAIREAIALIATDRPQAAAIYVKAEPSKLPADYFAKLLGEPELRFTLAPENSVRIAEFLARVGALKHKPDDWKDYFFPELHGETGN